MYVILYVFTECIRAPSSQYNSYILYSYIFNLKSVCIKPVPENSIWNKPQSQPKPNKTIFIGSKKDLSPKTIFVDVHPDPKSEMKEC